MVDSVIFDLDGTLWDATGTVIDCWNEVLDRHDGIRRSPNGCSPISPRSGGRPSSTNASGRKMSFWPATAPGCIPAWRRRPRL